MGFISPADLEAVNLGVAARSGCHLGPQESGELSGDRGGHDALDVLACG